MCPFRVLSCVNTKVHAVIILLTFNLAFRSTHFPPFNSFSIDAVAVSLGRIFEGVDIANAHNPVTGISSLLRELVPLHQVELLDAFNV